MAMVLCMAACTVGLPESGLPAPESVVYFGVWGASGSMEPISWTVLDNGGGQLMLLSTYIIDAKAFDDSGQPFASSDIKAWLDGTFSDLAFSDAEKDAMAGNATLLSAAQAGSYFADDTARAATATSFAVSAGCSDNMWWLSDDAGDADHAAAVDGAGAVTSAEKTDVTIGVRPVIRIDADAIAAVMDNDEASDFSSSTEGEMSLTASLGGPYALAVYDSSLPALTITGFTLEDDKLTVDCSTSSPLTGGQKIFCYLLCTGGILYGGPTTIDCFGWSDLTDGKAVFKDFPCWQQYQAILAVGVPAAGNNLTSYAGSRAVIDKVDYLTITGIEPGDHFKTGKSIPFGATGYKTNKPSPESDELRWVPVSWSVDTQSGTWSGLPYTSSFTLSTPGDYTLTVTYTCQSYSITDGAWEDYSAITEDQTRSVTFTVDQAVELSSSDADGEIYTGGRITLTPNVDGGTWDWDHSFFSATFNSPATFTALKAGTTTITYTLSGVSTTYDVTITNLTITNLTISSSDSDGTIYTGGRITLTPSGGGGAWSFDETYLSREGNTFTALKAGTVTITYTVDGSSAAYVMTILASELPTTGQDGTWIYILIAMGASALAAGIVIVMRRAGKTRIA